MPEKIRSKAGNYVSPLFVFNFDQLSPDNYRDKKVFNPVNFVSVNTEKPLMRFFFVTRILVCVLLAFAFFSCNKKTEIYQTESINDYLPLAVNKYITYRIDSTVFTNFGRNTEVHSYQMKFVVDAQITDNLGRPSFRVFRYIRDTAGTQPWVPVYNTSTYFITPLTDQIELVEDNLRFIKLHAPVTSGFSWKGNKYLTYDPYNSLYNFSNDDEMQEWDFYYDTFEPSFSYRGNNYTNVYTIEEVDESLNVPITNPNGYASKNRAVEKYSKNLGLVYREYEMWEYQPGTGSGPYKTGFGLKMWMIDHN